MATQALRNSSSRSIAKRLAVRNNNVTAPEMRLGLAPRRRAFWLVPVAALALCFAFAPCAYAQSAEPIQTVIPVNLDAGTGNITVGTTVYAGSNPGMNMVALTRSPSSPGVISPVNNQSNQTFTDPSSANQFLQSVLNSSPDAILILNAVGNYGFGLNAIADNLHQFGAAHDIDQISTAIPFTFIGNGGLNVGQAHQCGGTCNTAGYFATDSNTNYTFIQPDYVTFHITTDGTIQIGSTTYTVAGSGKVPGCDGTNAFHVVAVQRAAPQVLIGNESYCTAANPTAEFPHLHNDLSALAQSEANLVFVASNGHPISPDWNFGTDGDARVYPVAQDVAQLGGFFETMVYLTPTDTYSLAGAAAPPSWVKGARTRAKESSSVYPNHPSGELHGVLGRGLRGNWYSPLSADTSGVANLGFYEILGQPPTPFPHPAPGNDQEQAYFQTISTKICGAGCNVRNNYHNAVSNVSDYLSDLQGVNTDPATGKPCPIPVLPPSSPPPPTTPFCNVWQQLYTELNYVGGISEFYGQLSDLWVTSGTISILAQLSAQNDIEANLPPPVAPQAPSLAGPFVNLFLGLASLLPLPGPLGSLVGLADTAFNFATSLTTDANGNQTISLSSTASELQQQALNDFTAQGTTLGTQFDFIYQDWGKINTLGSALYSAQVGTPWYWDLSYTGQLANRMVPALRASYYQSLMAAIYAVGSYVPGGAFGLPAWGQTPLWQQPSSYIALDVDLQGQNTAAQPFNFPYYHPYTFPSDSNNPVEVLGNPAYNPATSTLLADNAWLGISAQNTEWDGGSCCGPSGLYVAPADSILSELFTPQSSGGNGLGVYRPAFFEGWAFPRVTCEPNLDVDGDFGFGCDFGAAAPLPEALPAPVTSVSIKTAGISRNGTQVDLWLKITNNGTTESTSTEIGDITLRTLAGAGEATLVEPGLPIHIGKLLPGSFTRVALTLNVPHSVNKLELTETGTVDSGESAPHQFSLGQVIRPKKEK
jgi:hypothetical protein